MRPITSYSITFTLLFTFYLFAQEPIWMQTNGPLTGNANSFAKNSNGAVFAGTADGYIYKSDDGGASWYALDAEGAPKRIFSLLIPDGNTIYAGTSGRGIFKSKDNGATWTDISDNSIGMQWWSITAIGSNPSGDIFIGAWGDNGIYISSDQGENWTPAKNSDLNLNTNTIVRGFAFSPSGDIYASVSNSGIFMSTNNGVNWTSIGDNLPQTKFHDIIYTDASNLLVTINGEGIYRTPDNGLNWTAVNSGITNMYTRVLSITPNGEILCGGGNYIFRSTDEGDSWIQIDQGITIMAINELLALNSFIILAGTQGQGIFRTTDNGSTWSEANSGLVNSAIHALEIVGPGTNFPSGAIIAGTGNMVYITTNNGDTWDFKSSGIPSTMIYDLTSINQGNAIFAATSWGLARSTNKGDTWVTLNNGIPEDRSYRAVVVDKNNGYIYTAHYGYSTTNYASVYRSSDNGDSWTEINNGLSFDTNTGVNGIIIDQNSHIYMATDDYDTPQGIYYSIDNGDSWQQMNDGLPSLRIYSIALSPNGNLYTSLGSSGAFRYDFDRKIWEQISSIFTESIACNSPGHIFLGTLSGIQRSIDGGQNWELFNLGFPPSSDNVIESMAVDGSDNMYAGTNATGVYKTISPTTVPWPILAEPYDSAYAVPLELNLKWDLVAEATEYQIQVSDSPDFINLIVDEGGLTAGQYLLTGLQHYTQYFWRVRALNGFAVSAWSNVWMFMTIQKGPDLTDPVNNSTDLNTDITFSWTGVDNAIGYDLELSFTSDFSTIEDSVTNISDKTYIIYDLISGKTYFWRIRGLFNGGVTTDWSDVFTFTTIRSGPDLSFPPDNKTDIAIFIDFSWRSVNNAAKYQLQISTDPQFSYSEFNIDTISSTHYYQTLLSHSQQYYWRVRAIFDDGLSAWSEIWTFTTLRAGPTLNIPDDNATGVGTTVNFNWNTVASAVEYHIQVSTDINFGTPEYDKDQIASTAYQITNLPYSNTYYWHVRAIFTDASFTDWSETRMFRTRLSPVDLVSPGNDAVDVTLPAAFTWNGQPNASSYWLQISQIDDFTDQIVFDENNITLTNQVVSILDFNTQYFWRVAAMDNGAAGEWSPTWSFDTQDYPSTINANTTVQFPTYNEPGDYKATDYRLFGLPGNGDLSFDQIFGTGAGEQWTAYYDEYDTGNSANVFVEYLPDDGRFQFSQGKGFWIIKKGPLVINMEVSSAILNDQNQAYISLHNGWNIITNPFPFTVSWQVVCDLNELGSIPLYSYNGSFNNATMLEPYQGYYVDNPDNRSDIFIPYIESIPKVTTNIAHLTWQLNIILNSGKFEDAITWLGISDVAKPEIDKFDYRKPRAIGSVPRVYFDRSEWGGKWASMASDIRPEIDDKAIWDFDVDAPAGQRARLSFTESENIPAEYAVYLIDRSKLRSINLRLEDDYVFTPVTNHSKFAIIIGNETAVEEELQAIVPKEFILGSNYPNPFNPETVIPIELAEAGQLTIKIYNILGEQVRILFHGSLETGRHQFTWDGTNQAGQSCPSGIYLYHVNGDNGIKATKRMVLVK